MHPGRRGAPQSASLIVSYGWRRCQPPVGATASAASSFIPVCGQARALRCCTAQWVCCSVAAGMCERRRKPTCFLAGRWGDPMPTLRAASAACRSLAAVAAAACASACVQDNCGNIVIVTVVIVFVIFICYYYSSCRAQLPPLLAFPPFSLMDGWYGHPTEVVRGPQGLEQMQGTRTCACSALSTRSCRRAPSCSCRAIVVDAEDAVMCAARSRSLPAASRSAAT